MTQISEADFQREQPGGIEAALRELDGFLEEQGTTEV